MKSIKQKVTMSVFGFVLISGFLAPPDTWGEDPQKKTQTVVPDASLAAGKTHRWLFGSGYRDLWTTAIEIDVLDLRTLVPLDMDTILVSVGKTGRLVVATESHAFCGLSAEISAQVCERAFGELKAPPHRLGSKFVPLPYSPPMESFVIPAADDIVGAVKAVLE